MFLRNTGGPVPVRAYLPELLAQDEGFDAGASSPSNPVESAKGGLLELRPDRALAHSPPSEQRRQSSVQTPQLRPGIPDPSS